MLKKNKGKIILSSILILLPMLFGILMWNRLPDTITTHWGADGHADGFSGKAFTVFGLPCLLLLLHFVCLLVTALDKKQSAQNPKALNMIFWIMPMISFFANGVVYRAAFGMEIHVLLLVPVLLGFLFLFMGNYLPKTRQNKTLGIKVSWALQNEENWNKTHRLAGKVWVIGGLALFVSALLPPKAMMWVMIITCIAVVGIPICYSYGIYKKHQKAGIVYEAPPKSKGEKIAGAVVTLLLAVLLVGVAIVMFTGHIEATCEADSLKLHATYYRDIQVEYGEIDTAQYRKDLDVGVRTNGFGSARLSVGTFQNEEFGAYTLYAYTGARDFIVLTADGETLVIGLTDAGAAQALYEAILSRIP